MSVFAFALAVFFVGFLLGLWFKVFILMPAVAIGFIVAAGAGFQYENCVGFILFVTFLGITTLQIGYLFGSVVAAYVPAVYRRNRRLGFSETAQQLFRRSQT